MSRHKILVVDDDPKILKIVEHSLRREDYQVVTAVNGEEAVARFGREKPDLVVLDLMLPKMDGFEVCQKLRNQGDVPIIILSAKGDEVDKIVGFKLGVDDYLTKPFSPSELVLRVKAILRRVKEKEPAPTGVLEYPNLRIEYSTRKVLIEGRPVELTAKEFDLLWFLAANPGQVFSRMQLLNHIWHSDYPGDENTVTVQIRRLREKIEKDPANPVFIRTVWGVGYKFEK